MQKQSGFSPLIVVLIIAVIVVGGIVGWRVWETNKATQQSSQTQNNSQQNTQSIKDPNEGYVVIKEWGVRFKPVEGLVYTIDGQVASFSTEQLSKQDPKCTASDAPLGRLTRTIELIPGSGSIRVKIGDYHYLYDSPHSVCSDNNTASGMQGSILPMLKTSISTLEEAK